MKRNNIIFFTFLLIIFSTLNILLFNLLKGGNKNDTLYIQYSAERALNILFESYIRGNKDIIEDYSDYIISFGVYNAKTGQAEYRQGNAPPRINGKEVLDEHGFFKFNNNKKSILMVRPYGDNRMPMLRDRSNNTMRNLMRRGAAAGFIYIELSVKDYFQKMFFRNIAFYVFPLTTTLLFVLFGYVYLKNQKYKLDFEKHKNLAKLGEVSRTLAHEIKNPLGALKIQTSYLKKILPEKYKNELDIIDEEVSRLNTLTEKISDFIKDPLGYPQPVELKIFIHSIKERFDYPIEIRGDNEAYNVNFDLQRLRSVFENIIKNGIESSYDAESDKPIEIKLIKEKRKIEISVRDYGVGISDEKLENIFDPFYTTKSKGSGIGLAVCRQFVEAAGGIINIVNSVSDGVVVKVILPEVNSENTDSR